MFILVTSVITEQLKILQIHLFYIATNNNLAYVTYDNFNGSWTNHTELVDSRGLPFRAAVDSRILLAKRLGNSTPSSLQVVLHYENADRNVITLEGQNIPPSNAWAIQDISSKLNSSLGRQGILKVPCASMRRGGGVRLISTEQTGDNLSENPTAITADYKDGKFNSSRFEQSWVQRRKSDVSSASEDNMFDPISIGESDLQLALKANQVYAFWVNGTRLASFSTVHSSPNIQTMPTTSFPYVRLAGIIPTTHSVYYLYNQIGPDTLVENQWDLDHDNWTPRKINITEL